MLEQQMLGKVRISYLPDCISPDEVEAALARISPAEANVFAHEALDGCSLSLVWTNRAAGVLNAPISGIAQTFTARDPDKITGLASVMIQASRRIAHRLTP
ncbi:hypothetical protein [Paraburkholderia diazotrophica]|uniref:Uncharacterized protein n=1 Tax=Paraburkholderia diazotrophica TaxID=667676 RepID=A0A1H7E4R4_9BURK|nr:hypothetical protein [Paraburkholderia diazotrophica]SEK08858.1 hypothetical protein SAMN05192539_104238 [Paraburkholderia diazotrophica]